MTITLDLTQEEEIRLQQAARREGIPPQDYLRNIVRQLPAQQSKRQLRGYGMLARLGDTVEEFHRERQEDRVRENREHEEDGA